VFTHLRLGADLHMAQLMPLPLTSSCSSKSRLVLPLWYQLTQVVLNKVDGGCKAVVVVVVNISGMLRLAACYIVSVTAISLC